MKKIIASLFITCVSIIAYTQSSVSKNNTRVLLPNGWSLTPAGTQIPLGDLPLNIAVSPSNHLMAVTNNGQSTQSLQLIDAKAERLL